MSYFDLIMKAIYKKMTTTNSITLQKSLQHIYSASLVYSYSVSSKENHCLNNIIRLLYKQLATVSCPTAKAGLIELLDKAKTYYYYSNSSAKLYKNYIVLSLAPEDRDKKKNSFCKSIADSLFNKLNKDSLINLFLNTEPNKFSCFDEWEEEEHDGEQDDLFNLFDDLEEQDSEQNDLFDDLEEQDDLAGEQFSLFDDFPTFDEAIEIPEDQGEEHDNLAWEQLRFSNGFSLFDGFPTFDVAIEIPEDYDEEQDGEEYNLFDEQDDLFSNDDLFEDTDDHFDNAEEQSSLIERLLRQFKGQDKKTNEQDNSAEDSVPLPDDPFADYNEQDNSTEDPVPYHVKSHDEEVYEQCWHKAIQETHTGKHINELITFAKNASVHVTVKISSPLVINFCESLDNLSTAVEEPRNIMKVIKLALASRVHAKCAVEHYFFSTVIHRACSELQMLLVKENEVTTEKLKTAQEDSLTAVANKNTEKSEQALPKDTSFMCIEGEEQNIEIEDTSEDRSYLDSLFDNPQETKPSDEPNTSDKPNTSDEPKPEKRTRGRKKKKD